MQRKGLPRPTRTPGTVVQWSLTISLGAAIAGCFPAADDRLTGAWEVIDAPEPTRVEFFGGGAVRRTVDGCIAYEGRYRLVANDRIEEEVALMGEVRTRQRRFAFTAEGLTLMDDAGRQERLRRLP